MKTNNLKNIVVLKSLPSNIVEEAIVILKSNKYAKKLQMIDKNNKNESNKTNFDGKEYVIREAEALLTSYISKVENSRTIEKPNKIIKQKYERLKKYSFIVTIFFVISVIINFI